MTSFTPDLEHLRAAWNHKRWDHLRLSVVESDAEFDRCLAEHDRRIAEVAFDDGVSAGWVSTNETLSTAKAYNPYRKDQTP